MVVGRAAGKFKRPKVGLAVIKQGSNGINISEDESLFLTELAKKYWEDLYNKIINFFRII